MGQDAERVRGAYETRGCPQCGSELYADVPVCYGCLYEFASEGEGAEGREAIGGGEADRTLSLAAVEAGPHPLDCPGAYLRTASVDLWTPVPEEGVVLGRDSSSEVVLHSPAVSRRHLRLVPTSDGMEVSDLGSTNPACYHGRPVTQRVVVPYGDSLEVCGAIVTMTGPGASP